MQHSVSFDRLQNSFNHRAGVQLFLAGCLAAVGTALIVAMQYWDDFFPVKPGRQTEYLGLRFGMSRDEVRYVKGVPENVVGGEKDKDGFLAVLKSSEVPKAKTTDDYPLWMYERNSHREDVMFGRGTTVQSVGCFSNDKAYRCPAFGGVRDCTSEIDMIRKLGKPSKSTISGVSRWGGCFGPPQRSPSQSSQGTARKGHYTDTTFGFRSHFKRLRRTSNSRKGRGRIYVLRA